MTSVNNRTVSVIIPVYNVKNYLGRCLESVFKQDYTQIEIILVDDGSSDGSSELCDVYAKTEERAIVMHKKNGGVSSARNAGLEIATGEYVTFIDADDEVDSNYIATLVDLLEKTKSDISFVSYRQIFSDKVEDMIQPLNGMFDFKSIKNVFYVYGGICCCMFKLSIIRKYNLFFREDLKNMEDCVFKFQYLICVRYAAVSNSILYSYYMRDESAVHTYNSEYDNCIIEYSKSIINFLKSLDNVPEISLNAAIQRFCIMEIRELNEYYQCFMPKDKNSIKKRILKLYDVLNLKSVFKQKSSYNYEINCSLFRHVMHILLRLGFPLIYMKLELPIKTIDKHYYMGKTKLFSWARCIKSIFRNTK